MSGETWTNEQAKRLWAMSISPVRSSPEKIKVMIDHFKTPEASIHAITDGGGPLAVSKPFARKIRKLVADGDLDWVTDEAPGRPKRGDDSEWRGMLLSHVTEFSLAVDAYKQDLGIRIQTSEIHQRLRSGVRPAKVPYGPSHRPFIESIFSRSADLEDLRREFESTLKTADLAGAKELSEKIGSELVDRIAI